MKPETFQDAMTLLPEELLTPVDALRRRKPFSWLSLLATAACLFLVIGLAIGYSMIIAPASAENGAAPDVEDEPKQEAVNQSQSQADAPSLVEVVQVEEDHIYVVTAVSNSSDSCALRAPIKITYEKLTQIPMLEVGQILKIYWETEDYDATQHAISPYRMEISEE